MEVEGSRYRQKFSYKRSIFRARMGMDQRIWWSNFRTAKGLGCSCDWDRTKFTMDEDMNEAVIKVFVDLYNKDLFTKAIEW